MPAYLAKELLTKPVKLTKGDDSSDDLKHKKSDLASTSSQTSPIITEKDLTSTESPSAAYWEVLAEKRRVALVETLEENEYLHEKVQTLESELNHSKSMLQQSRELVEVLTEMLQEKENEMNERADGEHAATQYSHISEAAEADEEYEEDKESDTKSQSDENEDEPETTPAGDTTKAEINEDSNSSK